MKQEVCVGGGELGGWGGQVDGMEEEKGHLEVGGGGGEKRHFRVDI